MRELQSQTRQCGEYEYEVTPLPAGKALQVLRRLGKSVGPAIAKIGEMDAKSLDLGKLGEALEELLTTLSDDDVAFINKTFASATTIVKGDARPELGSQFDLHFQGALGEWFEWLKFSLEVNYGPLVSALGASVGGRRAAVAG
jgi:hypothetical protein